MAEFGVSPFSTVETTGVSVASQPSVWYFPGSTQGIPARAVSILRGDRGHLDSIATDRGSDAGQDRIIEITYPSVAATAIGKLIGRFAHPPDPHRRGEALLPVVRIAAGASRRVAVLADESHRKSLSADESGDRSPQVHRRCLVKRVDWRRSRMSRSAVEGGQAFHRAGEVELRDAKGSILGTLSGVVWPERLKSAILETRDARVQNDAAFLQIQARK